MELLGQRLSPGRKKIKIQLLTAAALAGFESQTEREYWIALVGRESAYDGSARSSVGAVGLGQLMPKYAEAFAEQCGLAGVSAKDLTDDATNLALSACVFKDLLTRTKSIPLALAAYNAGLSSKGLASLRQGGPASAETNGYISTVWALREAVK